MQIHFNIEYVCIYCQFTSYSVAYMPAPRQFTGLFSSNFFCLLSGNKTTKSINVQWMCVFCKQQLFPVPLLFAARCVVCAVASRPNKPLLCLYAKIVFYAVVRTCVPHWFLRVRRMVGWMNWRKIFMGFLLLPVLDRRIGQTSWFSEWAKTIWKW